MKPFLSTILLLALFCGITSCKKSEENNATTTITSETVVRDIVQVIVLPQYGLLNERASALQASVNALSTAPDAAKLEQARSDWRAARAAWELCEGFLLGPVEDNNYDPNMDTWPVDHRQLDSFIANSPAINTSTVSGLNQALRGFHPLEYILWGHGGTATVDSISDRDKQYMNALCWDITNNTTALNGSWSAGQGNFRDQLLLAGKGSTRYNSRQEVLLAVVNAMSGICEEVGGGKIYDPFTEMDSTKSESPFSHNSMTDFINNIQGAKNVYLCTVNGAAGASIGALVSTRNLSLNNKIINQFDAAIAALQTVNVTFELAIHTQRVPLQNAMDAIHTLHETLDHDLKDHIITYVKD